MKVTHPSMPHMSSQPQSGGDGQMVAPKVFTVAPPDDEAIFEQQMAQMEPELTKATPADAKSDDPLLKKEVDKKIAFEKLMFLSKDYTKDVEYGGLIFKFKVLKSSDNAKILNVLQAMGTDDPYKASLMGLAASIVSVNDIKFEDFYSGTDEISDSLMKKYSELSRWPGFMITTLMTFSSKVQVEAEKEFSGSFLKV